MSPPGLLCGRLGKHAAFPEFCAKRKNGFVALEFCFAAGLSTKQSHKNTSDFSWMKLSSSGLKAIVHWPTGRLLGRSHNFLRWITPRFGGELLEWGAAAEPAHRLGLLNLAAVQPLQPVARCGPASIRDFSRGF
jgi:hypothetical protein